MVFGRLITALILQERIVFGLAFSISLSNIFATSPLLLLQCSEWRLTFPMHIPPYTGQRKLCKINGERLRRFVSQYGV